MPNTKPTIKEVIDMTGGRATGFDYLRVVLAISIVAWHTIVVSYGGQAQEAAYAGPFRPIVAIALPLFFALSGFLVAGSLERNNLKKFLGLRVLRILPALSVETFVCALLIGPALSVLSLRDYFHDPLFYKYLLNVFGIIHYQLPGLFLSNPDPSTVNGQLWTVPFELECYIVLAGLAFCGIQKRPWLILVAVFALSLTLMFGKLIHHGGHATVTVGPVNGHLLVGTFLAGAYLYLLKNTIRHSGLLFVFALIAFGACLTLPLGDCFIAFPAAYVTVYIGLLNPKAALLHRLGDLSYGIFLFGYPIQQTVADLGGPWTHHWYMSLLIALPITIIFSWCSWNFVERPALSLKRYL